MIDWHILVIEDEHDSAEMIAEILAHHSILSTQVGSAEDAMALLGEWQPTAMIVDLHLPGSDGWTFMKRARALPQLEHVPLFATTAYHTPALARQAVEEGFDAFFPKPINVADFVSRISTIIEAKAAR
jgi:CheY-like chemotaxis protein